MALSSDDRESDEGDFSLSVTVQADTTVILTVGGSRATIEIAEVEHTVDPPSTRPSTHPRTNPSTNQVTGSTVEKLLVDYTGHTQQPGNSLYQQALESHAATWPPNDHGVLEILERFTLLRMVNGNVLTLSAQSARNVVRKALTQLATPSTAAPPTRERKRSHESIARQRTTFKAPRVAIEPTNPDGKPIVYCGNRKGHQNHCHPGNLAYQQAVAAAQGAYQTSNSSQRRVIVEAIANHFDFYQSNGGQWRSAPREWVWKKIEKALPLARSAKNEASVESPDVDETTDPMPDHVVDPSVTETLPAPALPSAHSHAMDVVDPLATETLPVPALPCAHSDAMDEAVDDTMENAPKKRVVHMDVPEDPGHAAYKVCLTALHTLYLQAKTSSERNSIIGVVLQKFDFVQHHQPLCEARAREMVRRALVNSRGPRPAVAAVSMDAPSPLAPAALALSHAVDSKRTVTDPPVDVGPTKPRSCPPLRTTPSPMATILPPTPSTEQRPRSKLELNFMAQLTGKLVVYCAPVNFTEEPGNSAYIQYVLMNCSTYLSASRREQESVMRSVFERFSFQRPVDMSLNLWVEADPDWIKKRHLAFVEYRHAYATVASSRREPYVEWSDAPYRPQPTNVDPRNDLSTLLTSHRPNEPTTRVYQCKHALVEILPRPPTRPTEPTTKVDRLDAPPQTRAPNGPNESATQANHLGRRTKPTSPQAAAESPRGAGSQATPTMERTTKELDNLAKSTGKLVVYCGSGDNTREPGNIAYSNRVQVNRRAYLRAMKEEQESIVSFLLEHFIFQRPADTKNTWIEADPGWVKERSHAALRADGHLDDILAQSRAADRATELSGDTSTAIVAPTKPTHPSSKVGQLKDAPTNSAMPNGPAEPATNVNTLKDAPTNSAKPNGPAEPATNVSTWNEAPAKSIAPQPVEPATAVNHVEGTPTRSAKPAASLLPNVLRPTERHATMESLLQSASATGKPLVFCGISNWRTLPGNDAYMNALFAKRYVYLSADKGTKESIVTEFSNHFEFYKRVPKEVDLWQPSQPIEIATMIDKSYHNWVSFRKRGKNQDGGTGNGKAEPTHSTVPCPLDPANGTTVHTVTPPPPLGQAVASATLAPSGVQQMTLFRATMQTNETMDEVEIMMRNDG